MAGSAFAPGPFTAFSGGTDFDECSELPRNLTIRKKFPAFTNR